MKRTMLIVAATLALASCASHPPSRVKGYLEGKGHTQVQLSEINSEPGFDWPGDVCGLPHAGYAHAYLFLSKESLGVVCVGNSGNYYIQFETPAPTPRPDGA